MAGVCPSSKVKKKHDVERKEFVSHTPSSEPHSIEFFFLVLYVGITPNHDSQPCNAVPVSHRGELC